jgi:hypothetical protein
MESDPSKEWPTYLPGPRENIFALGVISLAYSNFEWLFAGVFREVTQTPDTVLRILFSKLPNNIRMETLSNFLEKMDWPEGLKDDIKHFMKGFQICAENRNLLMHSYSGGVRASTGDIVIMRTARSGDEVISLSTLPELREIADAINAFNSYAADVMVGINVFRQKKRKGEDISSFQSPSPDRPPLPRSLSWLPRPAEDLQTFVPPQQS